MRNAATAALGLLLACGPSRERQRLDTFRDTCYGLVSGAATLLEAAQRFDGGAYLTECPTSALLPLGGGVDHCDYGGAPVCRAFWVSYAYDQSLCGQPPLGGCYYWCEVRLPGTVVPPPADAVVCGAWFVSGQPCAPYQC